MKTSVIIIMQGTAVTAVKAVAGAWLPHHVGLASGLAGDDLPMAELGLAQFSSLRTLHRQLSSNGRMTPQRTLNRLRLS